VVSIHNRCSGEIYSASGAHWAGSGGHAALLVMASDLQQLTGGMMLVRGTVEKGWVRVHDPEAVDGVNAPLMHYSWVAITAETDIPGERVVDSGRR
jgi:hypothetical protein